DPPVDEPRSGALPLRARRPRAELDVHAVVGRTVESGDLGVVDDVVARDAADPATEEFGIPRQGLDSYGRHRGAMTMKPPVSYTRRYSRRTNSMKGASSRALLRP